MTTQPEISFEELDQMIAWNCEEKDQKKFYSLRSYIDIKDLHLFWLGKELDYRGNLDRKQIEEFLLTGNFFSDYVFDFLQEHEDTAFRIKHFSYILSHFYREQIKKQSGFLKSFFQFEREFLLVLSALRAKDLNRDIRWELQYEDLADLFVQSILVQESNEEYIPPLHLEELKHLYQAYRSKPHLLHKALEEYRFRKIQELGGDNPFTMNRILAYAMCLIIVEDWVHLDIEKGRALVASLC